MALIDFHAHMLPTEDGRAALLNTMKENQVTKTVVIPAGMVSPQVLSQQIACGGGVDSDAPNLEMLNLCKVFHEQLLPFFVANPHTDVMEYVALGREFYGLKLAPAVHGVSLLDPRTFTYLEIASQFHHTVYLHCLARPGFDIEALTTLAEQFSNIDFVLGHAGIGNCDFFAVDKIKNFENIYFETSGGFSLVVKYAMNKLGAGRILFGTEYPLQDPFLEKTKLERLNFDFTTLNGNAERLLRGVAHV